jgi:hypothetical protein
MKVLKCNPPPAEEDFKWVAQPFSICVWPALQALAGGPARNASQREAGGSRAQSRRTGKAPPSRDRAPIAGSTLRSDRWGEVFVNLVGYLRLLILLY